MSISSSFILILKFHVYIALIALAIFFAPFANDVKFTGFKIPKFPTYPKGENILNNAEKILIGSVRGPECFAVYKNELYLTSHGGIIYKLKEDKLEKVIKTGQECDGHWWEEELCGRPLGITFDSSGIMYFTDAYYGVFKTNMSSGVYNGELEQLVSMDKAINGKKPRIPNAIDVAKDGTIFWSDSSTSHGLNDGVLLLFPDGDGRFLKLDPKTGRNKVLMDNLSFSNGVVLSRDESFVLVAETFRSRVHKYHLKGPKAGSSEIFLDNLPGYPDNLRLNNNGQIVISLINPFKSGDNLVEILAPYPTIRKLIYKTVKLVDIIFTYLNGIYPHYIFAYGKNYVGHFESMSFITGKGIKMFIVKDNGDIEKIIESDDNKVSHICDIIDYRGYYYLASPFNNFLARVKHP